jgi:cob(I)alamin adenosyltransferase
MKIYTRKGDDGSTGLLGEARVNKGDLRIECIGSVDELNAAVGLAEAAAPEPIKGRLQQIQHECFNVGSRLAAGKDEERLAGMLPSLPETLITRLESEIDHAEAQCAPLRLFILPGGSEAAARLHLARAVCRRAERACVRLSQAEPLNPMVLKYLNRLADWLFMHARYANVLAGQGDVLWKK